MTTGSAAIYAFTPKGLELGLCLAKALDASLFAPESLRGAEAGAARAMDAQAPGRAFPGAGIAEARATETGAAGTGAAQKAAPAGEENKPAIIWFDNLANLAEKTFSRHDPHIFVGAAGIAVRCVAPLLRSKDRDPAVLVVDQRARHVVSLLSGHLGGANAWARALADFLGATPVITTATDVEGLPSLDEIARERGLVPADLADLESFKTVSAALLAQRQVRLFDPDSRLGLADNPLFVPAASIEEALKPLFGGLLAGPGVIVTEKTLPEAEDLPCPQGGVVLHPPTLFIGIGCRRGVPASAILRALREACSRASLAPASMAALASVDAKEREQGLLEAARSMGLPLFFYPVSVLGSLPVSKASPKTLERFGIAGVCEPAALAAAQGLRPSSRLFPDSLEAPFAETAGAENEPEGAALLPESPLWGAFAAGRIAVMEKEAEDRFFDAELLLPKFALNGVTVSAAVRRRAVL